MKELERIGCEVSDAAVAARRRLDGVTRLNMRYCGGMLDVSALLSDGWRISTPMNGNGYSTDRDGGITLRYQVAEEGSAYAAVVQCGKFLGERNAETRGPGYPYLTHAGLEEAIKKGKGLKAFLRRMLVRRINIDGHYDPKALSPVRESLTRVLEDAVAPRILVPPRGIEKDVEVWTVGCCNGRFGMKNEYDEKWATYEDVLFERNFSRACRYRGVVTVAGVVVNEEDVGGRAALARIGSPLLPIAFMDDARRIDEPELALQLMGWFFEKFRGRLDSIGDNDGRTVWERLALSATMLGNHQLAFESYLKKIDCTFADDSVDRDVRGLMLQARRYAAGRRQPAIETISRMLDNLARFSNVDKPAYEQTVSILRNARERCQSVNCKSGESIF